MQTIGERLEEARKKKGVSIREAAEATKIRGDYLVKFESNQFDIGLTEIYTRGFLRTYAGFLKIPADRIMSDYAALGRGDIRPRQPNREVYGRMDITVASNEADRAAQPEGSASTEPAASSKPQPHHPRGTGSSLPTGPDPAVVFKWVKIGGIAVGVVLLLVLLKTLFTSNSPAPVARTQPSPSTAVAPIATTAPAERAITLLASNPVHVSVQRKNPDESNGETLFTGTLNRGESRQVPWRGPLYITATASENLVLEVNGKRIGTLADFTRQTGYSTGQLPGP